MNKNARCAVIGGLLCAVIAATVLFTACKPLGGDFEEWQRTAKEKNFPFTVTFEEDDGDPAPAAIRDIAKGSKVTEPPDMTRAGYTFGGWYKEAAFTNRWDFYTDTVTKNITLYAKWIPITYTVQYNANGGTGNMADSTFTYDAPQNLRANTFTRAGYAFTGWERIGTGSVSFTNGQSVVNLASTAGETVTLYAVWSANAYTVADNANGGSGYMAASTLLIGMLQNLRTNTFTRAGYAFAGWARTASGAVEFTDGQSVASLTQTVGATVTLYAVWGTNVPGATLAAKLSWLQTNAVSNVDYTVEVSANESISPTTLSYSGRTNIGITLKGTGVVRTVSLSSNGTMLTVDNRVTLVLDNNITLQGQSNNNNSLVRVNSGGMLVMNNGSTVTGNTSSSSSSGTSYGGGVYVSRTFTMTGGKISGNTSYSGGGVYVGGGTFTMSGGEISGNTSEGNGGGVCMTEGNSGFARAFTIYGGKISGNSASGNRGGGGVFVGGDRSTFTMNGGEISNNTASSDYFQGGGVFNNMGTFRIVTGTVYGSNEGALSNIATNGAALFDNGGTAQRGTFNGSTWNSLGDLSTTNNTIRVVNGQLQ